MTSACLTVSDTGKKKQTYAQELIESAAIRLSLKGRLNPEMIRIFADTGANMSVTDVDGNTILSPEVFLTEWVESNDFDRGDPIKREIFATQVKVAKELLALGVPLHKKGRIPCISKSFKERAATQRGENLLVLIAAGGYEQLREYFKDGLCSGAFSEVHAIKSRDGKNGPDDARISMLTLLFAGLIYPETSGSLQELWRRMPQSWGLNIFLDSLKDVPVEDMEAFAPLFVNIMAIQGGRGGVLRIMGENLGVLIQLLSASMDKDPEAVVGFISRKLKGQMKDWTGADGMEELTTRLGAFMRDKRMQSEIFGGLFF